MSADAATRFAQSYRAWVAGWRPGSELAEARAELHRFARVLVAPGAKSPAERRQLAEFDALVLRIPWLLDAQRGGAAYERMAAALRELTAALADSRPWAPPAAALDCGCDGCSHLLNAVALFVRAPP